MNQIDEMDDPITRAPLPAGKFPETAGKNRSQTAPSTASRNAKGRFLPGNNANPKGRPKGSLNQSTLFAKALLEDSAPAVARSVIEAAVKGNATAQKLVLERLIPRAHDRRLHFGQLTERSPRPRTDERTGEAFLRDQAIADDSTPEDILHAHNTLVGAVANGDLSPTEAQAISQLLEARRRSWEVLQFKRRLSAIEERAAESQLR